MGLENIDPNKEIDIEEINDLPEIEVEFNPQEKEGNLISFENLPTQEQDRVVLFLSNKNYKEFVGKTKNGDYIFNNFDGGKVRLDKSYLEKLEKRSN